MGPVGNPGIKGERGPPGPAGLPTLYLWRNTAEEWAAFQVRWEKQPHNRFVQSIVSLYRVIAVVRNDSLHHG